jgi:PEP-CTERM motif
MEFTMKSTPLLRALAFAGLCVTAGVANAANYSGTISFTQTAPSLWSGGFTQAVTVPFTALFSFTDPLPNPANGDWGTMNMNLDVTNAITNTFQLVDVTNGNSVIADFSNQPCNGSNAACSFNLPGSGNNIGDTFGIYVVGSLINGASSGNISGNVNISPVPEPKTYAMMLAGLGLLAFTARRRKTNSFFAY